MFGHVAECCGLWWKVVGSLHEFPACLLFLCCIVHSSCWNYVNKYIDSPHSFLGNHPFSQPLCPLQRCFHICIHCT
ncbi:hypothetical protein L873DRAFT_197173 [Choiromyces venosus 120613-1]|uniref:Uncharacterized protein n=1 Tax=Choiromyces venosus 120613-1 TaxID=1336337 RepID=A0A3N4J5N8_9PEZI|nr:hypothetical protein L873DRAFT_197173 [Choiromyces venosus 120613-1]